MEKEEQESEKWQLGTIVALKGNAFLPESAKLKIEKVTFSGSVESLSPLMVIIGLSKEPKDVYDASTGQHVIAKNSYQCQCLWFSTRSCEFNEVRIHSNNLKIIKEPVEDDQIPINEKNLVGKTVRFLTGQWESRKQKYSNVLRSDSYTPKIENIDTFVAPLLEVIGVYPNPNNKKFNVKDGKELNVSTTGHLKCKFFNSKSDKFSEYLIPIEAVEKINVFGNFEIIGELQNLIRKSQKIVHDSPKGSSHKRTILKPELVYYEGGEYWLRTHDYASGKPVYYSLSDNDFTVDKKDYLNEEDCLPKFEIFDEKKRDLKCKSLLDDKVFDDFIKPENVYLIKYKSLNENVTERLIYKAEKYILSTKKTYKDSTSGEEEEESFPYKYIKANCVLRNGEIRYFRLDRISHIEKVPLEISDVEHSE